MPHQPRSKHHITLAAIGFAVLALPAGAQTGINASPSRTCWVGKPLPKCNTIVITEIGMYTALRSTSIRDEISPGRIRVRKEFSEHGTLEFGALRNVTPTGAVGATAVVGFDGTGLRLGGKARYRRWLGNEGTSLELATGIVGATPRGAPGRALFLSTDATVNFRDFMAITARAEVGRSVNRTPAAFYGGLRMGSKPGAITAGLSALIFGIFVASVASAWGDS
jgi:hypothetical protein